MVSLPELRCLQPPSGFPGGAERLAARGLATAGGAGGVFFGGSDPINGLVSTGKSWFLPLNIYGIIGVSSRFCLKPSNDPTVGGFRPGRRHDHGAEAF